MRKSVCFVVLFAMVASANPKQGKTIEISRDSYHRVLQVKEKTEMLTTDWAFVVDSSHSTWKIAGTVLSGFRAATLSPLDELRFCTYVFNKKGSYKYKDWQNSSVDSFVAAEKFVGSNKGVNSYAADAITKALRQPKNKLTVIIISDGGFSDGDGLAGSPDNGKFIKKIIDANQIWRVSHGYEQAVIATIGIENFLCWPYYPKDTNARCMDTLQDIGVKWGGGFFYVQKLPKARLTR